MKKFYLSVILVVLYNISFSAPVINATSNGKWNETSTWSLNRLPKLGDTIVIPAGTVVMINDDQDFNGFVFIKVYGKIVFQGNNSTLTVDAPSVIIVYLTGQILGNSASQKIRYNNSIIFKGKDDPIVGYQMAT
ncbi:MAG: G8 domain-containing protein, partial [Flavisolibacter sp.]|nr:G8 domain-containing protein [Flavisolibacter sp.]